MANVQLVRLRTSIIALGYCLLMQAICAGTEIDFARDVRPILSDHCFTCHGPDAETRQGNLRLDLKESIFGEDTDSGAQPVVVGDAEASEVIRRLLSDDASEQMPPPEADKRPSVQQIKLLREWIDAGAEWKGHWAFETPVRPALPDVMQPAWARNPIDNFVLRRMEEHDLQPTLPADKVTLIRRLYLDLIGLPPQPEEVDAFLADESPTAYENLVDRLLDSPQYGEHMATFWLDAARFADTNGYQNDFRRSMWLWRDWVIDAYNDNMPFDQFTIEQLAGDMLPEATVDQKIASGFNRNHRTNTEGGSINEEWLVENVVDRVETTSTVFLGLTMGCARCHDHKYDPISQREFYQFFSYFYNIDEQGVYNERRGNAGPMVSVETADYKQRIADIEGRLQANHDEREAAAKRLAPEKQRWRDELLADLKQAVDCGDCLIAPAVNALQTSENEAHAIATSPLGETVRITDASDTGVDIRDAVEIDLDQGTTIAAWVRPTRYGAVISRMDKADGYRGFDVLLNPDGKMSVHLIHHWPNNATKVTTTRKLPLERWTFVSVTMAAPGRAADVSIAFDMQPVETNVEHDTLDGTIKTDHPTWIGMRVDTQPFAGQIAGLTLIKGVNDTESARPVYRAGLGKMASQSDVADDKLRIELENHFHKTLEELRPLLESSQQLEEELVSAKGELPTTMVMQERQTPRQAYVLNRGQYDRPDETQPVEPGIPALFASDAQPKNRLELARWLVDGRNPLTARVAVNHLWTRYFGTGLVETPENFGVQSPPPSHPELLDWLATEFVQLGWDMKALQKLIVTSATYRQSSAATADQFARDPNNRWLARGSRFRLPAETIRDNALAISGLLTKKIGGPSVKPYQPEGLWEELAGGAKEPPYVQATDENLYRRSLYTYRKRTVPHPTMSTFDGTSREICVVARGRTNTPLQALALLNDPTYVEAARQLATEAMLQSDSSEDRMVYAFRRALARRPSPDELAVLRRGFDRYLARFRQHPEQAEELISMGASSRDDSLDAAELAAFTTVSNVILNLDETITRE